MDHHIPPAVKFVMELFGWDEMTARRHVAQREELIRRAQQERHHIVAKILTTN